MPGATIRIDQDRPGPSTSSGTVGVARKDLWVGRTIRPTSTQAGNSSQQWTLLDKPSGSAATLLNATSVACEFTPDLPGSYRVRLVTNDGGAANVQILVAGVTYDTDGVLLWNGWRIPAFGEKSPENNFTGNARGWAEAIEKIVKDIAAFFTFDTTATKLYVKVAETINQGTAQGQANTLEAQLKTTDNAYHPLSTLAIPNNSMVLYEVEVLCIKSDASIGGYFKKARAFLNKAGVVSAASTKNGDKQFVSDPVVASPAWDVTVDDDGAGNARTNVNSQGDTVSWYVVRQGIRILPIP